MTLRFAAQNIHFNFTELSAALSVVGVPRRIGEIASGKKIFRD